MLSPGIVICTDYNTVLFSNIIQGNILLKKKKVTFFFLFFIHYKCRPINPGSIFLSFTIHISACFNSNSLKSIQFNLFSSIAMNFDALIDVLIKKGADSSAPIIHGICFCFSLCVTPAFVNYKIISILPLPWKAFTCTAYRSSLTISWLFFINKSTSHWLV